jgi:hypothetical protein
VFQPTRDVSLTRSSSVRLCIELARPAPRHRVTPKLVHEILGPALSRCALSRLELTRPFPLDAIFRGFI